MAKTPEFNPFQRGSQWVVSVPASLTSTGQRKRKVFATKSEAERFAGRMRAAYNSGSRSSVIPQSLAVEALEAQRILDGTGVSVLEAARMAAARAGDHSGNGAETFRERWARTMLTGEGHWSERYATDMDRVIRWLPDWFLATKCGLIDASEIERALTEGRKLTRSTIDTRARYVSAVMGFKEKHRKKIDVEILTFAQCGKLLRACESPTERRAIALLLFAGIRPDAERGEITRLQWDAFGADQIYLDRETSKVGDRYIPITPRLARHLRGHPKTGPVIPANWRRVWRRIRSAAKVTGQDITRHTFASHYLAAFGEDAAKAAMGHTRGSGTLFRHYRRAIEAETGKRYFR